MKKKRIWFSPFPGVGLRGVIIKKFIVWRKILYRDVNKECYAVWHTSYCGCILDRTR